MQRSAAAGVDAGAEPDRDPGLERLAAHVVPAPPGLERHLQAVGADPSEVTGLRRRLERLAPDVRKCIEVPAVIGDEIDPPGWPDIGT